MSWDAWPLESSCLSTGLASRPSCSTWNALSPVSELRTHARHNALLPQTLDKLLVSGRLALGLVPLRGAGGVAAVGPLLPCALALLPSLVAHGPQGRQQSLGLRLDRRGRRLLADQHREAGQQGPRGGASGPTRG